VSEERKLSISGIRGIVGRGLTCQDVIEYVQAFTTVCPGDRYFLGRDTRYSGTIYTPVVASALMELGKHVVDLGVVPSPTVLYTVREQDCAGGIIITASHNPSPWNALKLISSTGKYLTAAEFDSFVTQLASNDPAYVEFSHLGTKQESTSFLETYIDGICRLVDTDAIREAGFQVACDVGNGAGCTATPLLMERLGCRSTLLYSDPTKDFQREPEPLPSHLGGLEQLVQTLGSDVGFAQDPDADRLVLVTEHGNAISEEYTLGLCCDHYLNSHPGNVAVNLSTSRLIDDIAGRYGSSVFRAPVGEINVTELLLEKNGVIGGEGNGGVILPTFNYGRDSLLGMALILEHLALTKQTLSQWVNSMPVYTMIKEKVTTETLDFERLKEQLVQQYGPAHITETDGMRLDWDAFWLHLRRSNTEPVMRIIGEGTSAGQIQAIIHTVMQQVQNTE
jgi:phosphomannomutase